MNSKVNALLKNIENGFGDWVWIITGSRQAGDIAQLLFTLWFRGAFIPTMLYAVVFTFIK